MVPAIDIPSPTVKLLAIPTPPDTIKAPVVDDVDSVVSLTVRAPVEVALPSNPNAVVA